MRTPGAGCALTWGVSSGQVFHDVAYKAKDRADLVAGIDEFLDQVTVLPPGEWDPSIRIEPPKNVPSQVGAARGMGTTTPQILVNLEFPVWHRHTQARSTTSWSLIKYLKKYLF